MILKSAKDSGFGDFRRVLGPIWVLEFLTLPDFQSLERGPEKVRQIFATRLQRDTILRRNFLLGKETPPEIKGHQLDGQTHSPEFFCFEGGIHRSVPYLKYSRGTKQKLRSPPPRPLSCICLNFFMIGVFDGLSFMKNKFSNQPFLDHSKSKLVPISDPHCLTKQ